MQNLLEINIFTNIHNDKLINTNFYKNYILECYKILKLKPKKITLILCDNNYIKSLNHKYRNINKETDVLAFPSDEDNYAGEVFISYDKVISQSKTFSRTIEQETIFLFTHGLLHLLGFDHQTDEEELNMNNIQNLIIKHGEDNDI